MKQLRSILIHLHAWLLEFYPAHYYAEFGEECMDTFALLAGEARTPTALLILWWREVRDWPTCVVKEHCSSAKASLTGYINRQRQIQHSRPGLVPIEWTQGIPEWLIRIIQQNPLGHRLFDVLFASFWLLLLSPLFLIIPIIVRLDSIGPSIFRQQRVGADGKLYTMYKFRSMTTGKTSGATRERKRVVTRVGHMLRRYNLDEIPQLVNILKGEMSLIGSRPTLPK
ncbi:MAG: sugar transferase [Chloroflexota bacterium]